MNINDLTLEKVTSIAYNALSKIGCDRAGLLLQNTLKRLDTKCKQVTTLAICNKETIYVSEKFWVDELRTEEDAEQVILHEVFHSILGDTARLKEDSKHRTQLANIAADMRINRWISGFNVYTSSFFEKFYPNTGIHKLLRPNSEFKPAERFRGLYNEVWNQNRYNSPQSYDDIFDTLERTLPKITYNIKFIGSHPDDKNEDGLKPIPKDIEEAIRDEIIQQLGESGSSGAGYGSDIRSQIVDVLKTQQKISRKFLQRFAIDHNFNKLKAFFPVSRRRMSPIPINPSKRELFRAALGRPPIMWKAKGTKTAEKYSGVAIYLDLSGSVHSYLPRIVALISNLNKELTSVFGFSNKIVEHTLNDLRLGKLNTTGGTDFDCIASHIIENNFTKCILITDGEGSLNEKYYQQIKDQLKDCCMVLFEENNRESAIRYCWFARNYKLLTLDEVIA
jgi:hypothetical protein